MAHLIDLSAALGEYDFVIFDTTILIDAFRGRRPAASRALEQTRANQRRTSIVVMWEFLRKSDGPLRREEVRLRENWLSREKQIIDLDLEARTSTTFARVAAYRREPSRARRLPDLGRMHRQAGPARDLERETLLACERPPARGDKLTSSSRFNP